MKPDGGPTPLSLPELRAADPGAASPDLPAAATADADSASISLHDSAVHPADRARSFDLEAHLASIGRVSAGLTHELRSPLGAIRLGLELIGEHLVGAASREDAAAALADATDAVAHIEALLTAMRGLVRTHGGSARAFDLVALARVVQRSAVSAFPRVTFDVVAPDAQPVCCDDLRLRQVLENLVSNAAHATAGAERPRVRIHVYGARGGGGVVSVRDNGPGIAREEQEKIFEPFYTTRRDSGGTGLGLALCREYAVQMGVDLTLVSAPGRGACFRLRIP
jgi:signal transduction histidine kinase